MFPLYHNEQKYNWQLSHSPTIKCIWFTGLYLCYTDICTFLLAGLLISQCCQRFGKLVLYCVCKCRREYCNIFGKSGINENRSGIAQAFARNSCINSKLLILYITSGRQKSLCWFIWNLAATQTRLVWGKLRVKVNGECARMINDDVAVQCTFGWSAVYWAVWVHYSVTLFCAKVQFRISWSHV